MITYMIKGVASRYSSAFVGIFCAIRRGIFYRNEMSGSVSCAVDSLLSAHFTVILTSIACDFPLAPRLNARLLASDIFWFRIGTLSAALRCPSANQHL